MQNKSQFKTNQTETRYNFARQVRLLRESAGLSVKEMTQKTHITERHLQELELGKIDNIGNIFALAQFFDKKIKIEFY